MAQNLGTYTLKELSSLIAQDTLKITLSLILLSWLLCSLLCPCQWNTMSPLHWSLSVATRHFSIHLLLCAFFASPLFSPESFSYHAFLIYFILLSVISGITVKKKVYKFMVWVSDQVMKSGNLCIVLIAFVCSAILALRYTAVFLC